MKTYFSLSFIFLFLTPMLYAEAPDQKDHYVITANRINSKISKIGSSVTVVSKERIESSKKVYVSEILREVEGLDVVQSGAAGGNTAVFIRGTNSEHTLVLIDGIEANNPVSTNRSFNFADLTLDNVEKIEIVRGPQSTLYGSDAIGGVINIITKKGKGPLNAGIQTEAGSYRTYNESVSLGGSDEIFNFSLAASREDSSNISSAGFKYGNTEDDSYQNTAFSGRFGVNISDNAEANLIVRYTDARSDLDNEGGLYGDDPNRTLNNKAAFLRSEVKFNSFEDKLVQTIGVSHSRHDLDDNNDPDLSHPLDMLRSNFTGNMLKFDFQNNILVTPDNTLVLGVETEKEEANSVYRSDSSFGPFESILDDKDARTNGFYIQDQHNLSENFNLTLGGRLDDHSTFGSEETWRAAPSYYVPGTGTRFRGSYGTGFKAPSLLQLYSEYGNIDLEPEESYGWDVGIDQEVYGKEYVLGITYFDNSIDNLISFDPNTFIFTNILEAKTSGFEVFIDAAYTENLSAKLSYSYTETEDETTGLSLLRRARNKANLNINYKASHKLSLNANYKLVGSREDNNFSAYPAERVTLGSYGLFDCNLLYDLNSKSQLFLRANNIFDKEYEDVYGFGTLGAAYYAGIKITI